MSLESLPERYLTIEVSARPATFATAHEQPGTEASSHLLVMRRGNRDAGVVKVRPYDLNESTEAQRSLIRADQFR